MGVLWVPSYFRLVMNEPTQKDCRKLTIYLQPWHARSVHQGTVKGLDLQNLKGLRPSEIRSLETPVVSLVRPEASVEILVDGHNVRYEMAFVQQPAENLLRVIPDVTLGGPRLGMLRRGLRGETENGIPHRYQRFVERLFDNTGGVAMAAVEVVVGRKFHIGLDFFDHRSPSGLPVVGDVQDVLHENLYVDENTMTLEVLEDELLVICAIVFSNQVRVGFQLLSGGCPSGEWCNVWYRASGAALPLWRLGSGLWGDGKRRVSPAGLDRR
jgi:hypothetical protein